MNRRLGRVLAGSAAFVLLGTLTPIDAGTRADAAPANALGAVSVTKTVTRTKLDADGKATEVASKKVTLSVGQTKSLRGRQNVDIAWTGATPTGGLQGDPNGVLAGTQEYPMVLLECRGKDSTSVPTAQRLDQTTCWTHGAAQRFSTINASPFGAWRYDRYATTPERADVVGRPSSLPSTCPSPATAERWVPFRAVDGKTYDYGSQGCAGIPPEDYTFDSSARIQPPNSTFAPTNLDGSGSTKFNVTTVDENASLGCSATVACSIVAVPIMGISCDVHGRSPVAQNLPASDIPEPGDDTDNATAQCETKGNYRPGDLANNSLGPARSVSGNLWWSASNWRNRITVPLTFAPVSNACEQTGGGTPTAVYGSELMSEAATQWAPRFCLDPKLFKFTHVQTGEPLARQLLADPTSGVHAAFSGAVPTTGFPTPTVQAPVAMTGFSISYNVDNDKGEAVDNLRLTPRLLAKLITESYPGDDFDRFRAGQYPYLKGNPSNITGDPEFQALNPGIHAANGLSGPATLILLNSESDVTAALTSYLDADPEARAWLDGKADPWGMRVNPAYRKIALPLLRWPLLDTTVPYLGDNVTCTKNDPAPWLPLVASPLSNLAASSVAVQFAASPGKVGCGQLGDPGTAPEDQTQWVSFGRMQPGLRFVLGITTLGQAARYSMPSAALQSHADDPGEKFTDGSGRNFVRPTQAALRAGADQVVTDKDNRTWILPATALAKDVKAYPGTTPVYADVPVSGLSRTDAAHYAELLRFAAGEGQVPGSGNGDLPPGYLPLTKGNGLGDLAAYTRRAADAVAAQSGTVPGLTADRNPTGGATGSGGSAGNGGGTGGSGTNGGVPTGSAGGGAAAPGTVGTATTAPTAKAAPSTAASAAPGASAVAQTVKTPGTGLGIAGLVIPLLLGLALLGGLTAGWSRIGPQLRRSR